MSEQFYCPICDKSVNSKGEPFSSEWAVALHIASTGKAGNRSHTSWILRNSHLSHEEIRTQSNNRIADYILYPLEETLRNREKEREVAPSNSPRELTLTIEKKLQKHIKDTLVREYGDQWWRKGVPPAIRVESAKRFEESEDGGEPFNYVNFIDLPKVLEKQWNLFQGDFARLKPDFRQKSDFVDRLFECNNVRNRHSHGGRAPEGGTSQYIADLETAREMLRAVLVFVGESEGSSSM